MGGDAGLDDPLPPIPDSRPLGQLSMAVLVLLAAAAGARVVAADLGAVAGDRGVGGGVGLGEAGLFGFLVGAEATGVGVLELHLARGGFGLGAPLRARKSVVEGKRVSVRGDSGGRPNI